MGAGLSRNLEFVSTQLANLHRDAPLEHLEALLCDHALNSAPPIVWQARRQGRTPLFWGPLDDRGFTDLLHVFDLPVTYENATGFTIPRQPDSHRRDGTAGSSHDGSITEL